MTPQEQNHQAGWDGHPGRACEPGPPRRGHGGGLLRLREAGGFGCGQEERQAREESADRGGGTPDWRSLLSKGSEGG